MLIDRFIMRYLVASFLCLLAFSSAAYAKTKVDIYHVEVPMTDVKNPKTEAWSQGLEKVLIRASGDTKIVKNAVVKKALTDPSDYLAQFESGSLDNAPSMVMEFNPVQIQSLLSQAHAIFWPQERKSVLVWVIEDANFERQIGWEQSGLDSIVPLQHAAQAAGLPITLPLGDMDDMTQISAPDLWGGFDEPLTKASKRYPVDGVLVLKVTRMGDGAQVEWILHDMVPNKMDMQSKPISGSTEGKLSDSIELAIQQVSEYYAKQNKVAVNQATDDTLLANFSGIHTAKDFFTLEQLLKDLSSVAAVQVHQIQGDTVIFNIDLLSNINEFKQEAAKNRQLVKSDAPKPEVVSAAPLQADISTQETKAISTDVPVSAPKQADDQSKNQLWFEMK